MRWTSWRDCEERSIGPDGYRLTGTTHHFRSWLARPLSYSGTASTLAKEWRSWTLTSSIPAPRPSKPSNLISSNVTKTAASECDLWNRNELGDDLHPG